MSHERKPRLIDLSVDNTTSSDGRSRSDRRSHGGHKRGHKQHEKRKQQQELSSRSRLSTAALELLDKAIKGGTLVAARVTHWKDDGTQYFVNLLGGDFAGINGCRLPESDAFGVLKTGQEILVQVASRDQDGSNIYVSRTPAREKFMRMLESGCPVDGKLGTKEGLVHLLWTELAETGVTGMLLESELVDEREVPNASDLEIDEPADNMPQAGDVLQLVVVAAGKGGIKLSRKWAWPMSHKNDGQIEIVVAGPANNAVGEQVGVYAFVEGGLPVIIEGATLDAGTIATIKFTKVVPPTGRNASKGSLRAELVHVGPPTGQETTKVSTKWQQVLGYQRERTVLHVYVMDAKNGIVTAMLENGMLVTVIGSDGVCERGTSLQVRLIEVVQPNDGDRHGKVTAAIADSPADVVPVAAEPQTPVKPVPKILVVHDPEKEETVDNQQPQQQPVKHRPAAVVMTPPPASRKLDPVKSLRRPSLPVVLPTAGQQPAQQKQGKGSFTPLSFTPPKQQQRQTGTGTTNNGATVAAADADNDTEQSEERNLNAFELLSQGEFEVGKSYYSQELPIVNESGDGFTIDMGEHEVKLADGEVVKVKVRGNLPFVEVSSTDFDRDVFVRSNPGMVVLGWNKKDGTFNLSFRFAQLLAALRGKKSLRATVGNKLCREQDGQNGRRLTVVYTHKVSQYTTEGSIYVKPARTEGVALLKEGLEIEVEFDSYPPGLEFRLSQLPSVDGGPSSAEIWRQTAADQDSRSKAQTDELNARLAAGGGLASYRPLLKE